MPEPESWALEAQKQALQSKLQAGQTAKLQVLEQRLACDEKLKGLDGYLAALQEQLNAEWFKEPADAAPPR